MKKIISQILDYFNGKRMPEPYPKWEKSLGQLQKKFDYNFQDSTLLKAALTHKSYLRRHFGDHKAPSPFERMEFLGDSILGFVVSKELFARHPDEQEGKLSKLKSKIVSESTIELTIEMNIRESEAGMIDAFSAIHGVHNASLISYRGDVVS